MATPITYTISFMNNIQKSILLIYPNYRRKKAADGRTWNIISISSDDRYLVNVHGRIEPFGGLLLGPGVTFMECKKSPAQLMGGHFCHHHFGNIIRRCTESSTLPTFSYCKPARIFESTACCHRTTVFENHQNHLISILKNTIQSVWIAYFFKCVPEFSREKFTFRWFSNTVTPFYFYL